jgi:hypothetical protein
MAGGVWGRGLRRQQGQLWRWLRQQTAGDVGAEVEKTSRTALQVFAAADGSRCMGQRFGKTARTAMEVVLAADGRRCGVRGVRNSKDSFAGVCGSRRLVVCGGDV